MGERKSGGPRSGDTDREGLSPLRAFLLLGAIVVAVGAAGMFATREAPATATAEPRRSPDYSLTDEEAIAEFERLNAQLMQAYEERSIALAEEVFTSDSPMLPRVRSEIDSLIDASVVSATRFRPLKTQIVESTASGITLERVENVFPRFVTNSGNPTGSKRPFQEVTKWTLRQELGEWLLHDAVVTERNPRVGRRRG